MAHFKNIKSLEDLKNQFKTLARKNHPDAGGNAETMKAINCEYDQLFPIWKHRCDMAEPQAQKEETAYSTRSEFYTQNGWKGENYDSSKSLKEIAVIIRAYVKELYPTYKFSVRTSYASMCQELHVSLKEAPADIYKQNPDELTDDEKRMLRRKLYADNLFTKDNWTDKELSDVILAAWRDDDYYKTCNDAVSKMLEDINDQVNSFNYDDSDAMIDYFYKKFYFFGCAIVDLKIVPKTVRVTKQPETTVPITSADSADYEIKEDAHTKTGAKIWVVKLLRTLSREEYLQEAKKMKLIGGYYSKYKHGFIFSTDPTELLKNSKVA